MSKKHEYWMYRFEGSVYANGPIDKNKPVSEKEIRTYIKKRYEVPDAKFEVWPTVPWWEMTSETHTVTERSTAMLKAMSDDDG
tara:strand:- start:635 stop:883 length:249 start_codon:yes stop_codon:yes gene_type:complete